ncbi:MAG: MptD family putative ECF transporter S component [Lachnospiraceae bacterium]|nr:MptD family putative ECF transporter S component [Lachnospiraceae bacterium]
MKNGLKIKDVVMIALLTALYLVFYMVSMAGVTALGAFGHAVSPGLCALIAGSILFFMTRKVGKFGQFTILTAISLLLFTMMGAGYLPWIITSIVSAVIADLIASRECRPPVWKVALASGIMHIGQAWGSIVPSWFFVESYRENWIARGQTPEAMDEMIRYTQGAMGVLATAVVFVLAIAGVYLGYVILKKHLKEGQARPARA